jgi:uncharacterized membrane protein
MATTASKPRSAQAAASEAASVTRATAARKRASGNASGERVAKAAQARRTARAAGTSSNGSEPSSNGRSTTTRASSGESSGSKPKASASKPKASASKPKASASKPKASASKPKASASKPKASASKPKASASKPEAQGRSTASLRKSSGSGRSVAAKRPARSRGDDEPDGNQNGGENPVTSGGKQLASALFSSTSHRPKKHPIARAVAKKAAKRTLKTVGRRSLQAGGEALRSAGGLGRQAMRAGMSRVVDHRPPVQASVDVAAPISVVWSEWMTFEWFTEGLHSIEDVERDGDELTGRVVAPHERNWHAEIVDEREEQSFAWRSDEGTDCAGLVTFHRLSERLTRVEADLDVMPTNPGETFMLSLPVPARRAERVLQMFKAHVEFINPDVYEDEEEDSDASESGQPGDARAQSDDAAESQQKTDGDLEDAEND